MNGSSSSLDPLAAVALIFLSLSALAPGAKGSEPVVEVEEVVTSYVNPNNGSGPLWCYGAPLLVRIGPHHVYVAAPETGPDVPPLCNTRWQLFHRTNDGWQRVHAGERFEEREPCPLVQLPGGWLFLSTNPVIERGGTRGPSQPTLLEFGPGEKNDYTAREPVWVPDTAFTEHSYRGIAADPFERDVLLLNIHAGRPEYYWSLLDIEGNWAHQGKVAFPIRACYPQVALRRRAAHILAIGDIVEPVKEWREAKFEHLKRQWDYVFRRLFYTWTSDIGASDFAEPIEIANVDATAGHINNLDLWLDQEGRAHLLYLERNMQHPFMRDRFFPGEEMTASLQWVIIDDGEVVSRQSLLTHTEGAPGPVPGYARFHATHDGRLFVIEYLHGRDADGNDLTGNYARQILPEPAEPVRLALEHPFRTFFTATERGGNTPFDNTLDLFGLSSDPLTLRYARVRL